MAMTHNLPSQTFPRSAPVAALAGRLLSRWHHWTADLARDLKPAEPRTPEELLEWAGRYEKTQPSYASDLRAAALRAQDDAHRH
jgi:hypothetical protein